MRRQAQHQIIWHPADRRYRITITMKWGIAWPAIPFDSQEWHTWLASIPSFRFQGQHGHFTARKETRTRGGMYWIAYRHLGGQFVKKYIGSQGRVTIARLEEVAGELEQRTRSIDSLL